MKEPALWPGLSRETFWHTLWVWFHEVQKGEFWVIFQQENGEMLQEV